VAAQLLKNLHGNVKRCNLGRLLRVEEKVRERIKNGFHR
jgi:hypothetical protein